MKALAKWIAIVVVGFTIGGIGGYIISLAIQHESLKWLILGIMAFLLTVRFGMWLEKERRRKLMRSKISEFPRPYAKVR